MSTTFGPLRGATSIFTSRTSRTGSAAAFSASAFSAESLSAAAFSASAFSAAAFSAAAFSAAALSAAALSAAAFSAAAFSAAAFSAAAFSAAALSASAFSAAAFSAAAFSAAILSASAFSAAAFSAAAFSAFWRKPSPVRVVTLMRSTLSDSGSSSSLPFFLVLALSMISLNFTAVFTASCLAFISSPYAFSRRGSTSSETFAFGFDSSSKPFARRKSTRVPSPMLNCFVSLLNLISAIIDLCFNG